MRLVETLVVRDEVDIVDAQIAYHLDAGVDFVIATDHDSRDGTTDVLEAYAREGYLRRIPESGPMHESMWRTRMARLAATEHGAHWILNLDADVFWWPRQGSIKEILATVPEHYGSVGGMNRHFLPAPDDGSPFFERMTLRVTPPVAIHDPTSPWRPGSAVAHRAHPGVTVFHAGYAVAGEGLLPVPGWHPFDMLHFPYRSVEQWLRKTSRRAHGDKPLGIYVKGDVARDQDRVDEVFATVAVDERTAARGRARGSLVDDTRVRDRLRALVREGGTGTARFAPPGHGVNDARSHAVLHDAALTDLTALHDATLVRLQRRIDDVSVRTSTLERRTRSFSRT